MSHSRNKFVPLNAARNIPVETGCPGISRCERNASSCAGCPLDDGFQPPSDGYHCLIDALQPAQA